MIIVLIIYILIGLFLNAYHKELYQEKTILGWIPICNVYLLGKINFSKIGGWILVILLLLNGTYTITIGDVSNTYRIIPEEIGNFYYLFLFCLFIYSVVQYFRKRKRDIVTL